MNNRTIWGFSARGAKWAFWTFVLSSIAVMVLFVPAIYEKIEALIYWRDREKIEVLIAASPAIMSGFILLITGLFSGKDEWRMSARGLGIASGLCFIGMFISMIIFASSQSSLNWLKGYLLVSTPLTISLIPFIHSGFHAARYDKRKRP